MATFLGTHSMTYDDADDSGVLDQSDAVATLTYLFLGGVEIPAPGADACGPDPTPDDLGCESYPAENCP